MVYLYQFTREVLGSKITNQDQRDHDKKPLQALCNAIRYHPHLQLAYILLALQVQNVALCPKEQTPRKG